MPGLFNASELSLLDVLFGGTTFFPSTLYLAVSTTAPNEDGTGITEPGGGIGYARVAVPNNGTTFDVAALNGDIAEKKNAVGLNFLAATGSWGTLTHWIFFDSLTGGIPLIFGVLNPTANIAVNNQLRISAQAMIITLD